MKEPHTCGSSTPVAQAVSASLRFAGDDLLATNLALDLRLFNAAYESIDSEWCAQVSRYTVVRIPARIVGFGTASEHPDER